MYGQMEVNRQTQEDQLSKSLFQKYTRNMKVVFAKVVVVEVL